MWHLALDRSDSVLLVTRTHRLGVDTSATESHRGCTWEQSEAAGAVGGRCCSIHTVKGLLAPLRGCDWPV